MNITLIDLDGKLPNLALMRLSAYHKSQGDTVQLVKGVCAPDLFYHPDKVYLSCLFRWNKSLALFVQSQFGNICEIGGTGVDIGKRLPSEVEDCEPDYSLYPDYEPAIGFISRGCIRKCPWCVVPEKEGGIRRTSTAQQIVGNRKRAVFLDNNFLAMHGYENDLRWLIDNGIAVDFNVLDARLINDKAAKLLARCKWIRSLSIALDAPGQAKAVSKAAGLLSDYGVSFYDICVCVLIGFSNFEDDCERLLKVHDWGLRPFPMGYRDIETGEEPARGWDREIYRKYKRLIIRLPFASAVWDDFKREARNE